METTREKSTETRNHNQWVLAAGGVNGILHTGVLSRASELGINLKNDEFLGVSAGALIAAFVTNGYQPDEIAPIFKELLRARRNPMKLLLSFNPFNPIGIMVGGFFRLLPFMQEVVEKYNLKPNPRLRILACDHSHEPVVFSGEDYDLATALAASGSVPGAFQPVWFLQDGRVALLVDGAVYHYNPTQFTDGMCIVSKFKPATQLPSEWETPWDLYFHMREIFFPLAGNTRYVDETKHIVIETGMPNVAGLNLGISDATIDKMFKLGRETAGPILERAIADNRVKVRK